MRINARELRIGNLVNLCFEHKPGWFVASVTQIFDDNTINTDTEDFHLSGKQTYYFEGIPLTEEWLLKFGFVLEETANFSEYFNKSMGNIKSYVIDNVWFCSHFDWMCREKDITSKRGWYVGRRNTNERYRGKGWNYEGSAEVYHVHQLQNLHFALTGKELTINTQTKL